ncbi:uncharacterized protein J3R85_009699 [Psidium guajava]|nr:uncharacterized protein J3R85_009699 [Psidium guajava]
MESLLLIHHEGLGGYLGDIRGETRRCTDGGKTSRRGAFVNHRNRPEPRGARNTTDSRSTGRELESS